MLNVQGSSSLYWKTGLDNTGLEKDTKQAKGILANFADSVSKFDIFAALFAAASLYGKKLVSEVTTLAARYETMGIVMRNVGNNAGYTGKQMLEYQKALEKTGISMLSARQALTMMTQAHIDLDKATELGRVAQDAAVIANINSSEAFERLVEGIQKAQPLILRTLGINVTFEEGYAKMAKTLGKTSEELTVLEKTQSRTNTVMERATDIAGTYEAAMTTAGKQALSLERHMENLKVLIGAIFLPGYTQIISDITGGIVDLNSDLKDNETVIEDWGNKFRLTIIEIESEIVRLSMLIDKVGGWMSMMAQLPAVAPPVLQQPVYGMDYNKAVKESSEKTSKWSQDLADRYIKNEALLQKLADEHIALEVAMTDASKKAAQEQKDIAEAKLMAIRAGIKQLESEIEGFGLLDEKGQEDFTTKMTLLREKELEDTKARQQKLDDERLTEAIQLEEILQVEKDKIRKAGEKKSFDELIKDTRKFNKIQLQEYAAFLLKESELYADNDDTKQVILEKYADTMQKVFDAEIKAIGEVGSALGELGNLIGMFDSKVGNTLKSISRITDSIVAMKSATTGFGQLSGVLSAFSTVISVLNSFKMDDKSGEKQIAQMEKLNRLTEKQIDAIRRLNGDEALRGMVKLFQDLNNEIDTNVKSLLSLKASAVGGAKGAGKTLGEIFPLMTVKEIENLLTLKKKFSGDIGGMFILTDTLRENIKALVGDITDAQETLLDYIEDYKEILTGTTKESIADSIADGFMDGLSSAEVFADTFEGLMKNALTETFKRQFLDKMLGSWYERLAEAIESPEKVGGESKLTSGEAWKLGEEYKDIVDRARTLMMTIFGEAGLPKLFGGGGAEAGGALTGAIRGMSEETAGILSGQFNAIRMNTLELINLGEDMLVVNKDIKKNTSYNIHLKSIDNKLSSTGGAMPALRVSGGW